MSDKATNYQCPSCTGPLHYDGAAGRLQCDYCGSSFDPAEIEKLYAEKEQQAASQPETGSDTGEWQSSADEDWGTDADKMRVYSCPSCGAQLICEETTAATSCPYCGNPTVIPEQFSGILKPDYILPFKLSKEDAVSALKLATTTRVFRHGDTEITETSFYEVQRAGTLPFSRVPVDASRKMPDDYMDSIEPFDYAGLKPFSTAYLPGFFADKFDVSIEESSSRADKRCRQSLSDALQGTARNGRPYTSVTPTGEDIHLKRTGVHYALLPVWMLNTRWNGKNYMFAMNGQTGRMVGDLPVDRKRFWGLFAAVAAPMTAVLTALLYFL